MPIEFTPEYKYIEIKPFGDLTLSQGNQGDTIIIVNETPNSLTPSSGKITLAESPAQTEGIRDLSGGHDWSNTFGYFMLVSEAGGPDTITLNQNCSNLDEVITHLNTQLSLASHDHTQFLEAVPSSCSLHVVLRCKSTFSGEVHGFNLDNGPSGFDALGTIGWFSNGYVGVGDSYEYNKVSGSTFYLTSQLTKTYSSGIQVDTYYSSVDCQDLYNLSQEWNDEATNMKYLISMEATGKYSLGGGVYTDIVYVITNGWRIRFHPGNYQITLLGTVIASGGGSPLVLPFAGRAIVNFQVGTKGVIASPVISSSEQSSIAERVWSHTKGNKVYSDAEIMKKIETGRWKIENNQLIIYDEDGVTSLYVFNLKDKAGQPTEETPYEREPV